MAALLLAPGSDPLSALRSSYGPLLASDLKLKLPATVKSQLAAKKSSANDKVDGDSDDDDAAAADDDDKDNSNADDDADDDADDGGDDGDGDGNDDSAPSASNHPLESPVSYVSRSASELESLVADSLKKKGPSLTVRQSSRLVDFSSTLLLASLTLQCPSSVTASLAKSLCCVLGLASTSISPPELPSSPPTLALYQSAVKTYRSLMYRVSRFLSPLAETSSSRDHADDKDADQDTIVKAHLLALASGVSSAAAPALCLSAMLLARGGGAAGAAPKREARRSRWRRRRRRRVVVPPPPVCFPRPPPLLWSRSSGCCRNVCSPKRSPRRSSRWVLLSQSPTSCRTVSSQFPSLLSSR